MNCRQVRESMELYVLDGLDAPRKRSAAAHLAQCPDCRSLERRYRMLLDNLQSPRRPEQADSAFVANILAAAAPAVKRARTRRSCRRILLAATATAAALLLGLFLWNVLHYVDPPREPMHATGPIKPRETLWRKTDAVAAGMANADDMIVRDGTVFLLIERDGASFVTAIDANSGRTRWQSDTNTCGYLQTDGRRLYCIALKGQTRLALTALDLRDGAELWTFEQPAAAAQLRRFSAPAILGQNVCWTSGNTLYVLDADSGSQLWRRTFEHEHCVSRGVAVADGVCVAGRNGIYCAAAADGRLRWHLPHRFYTWPGSAPLIAANGPDRLFVAAGARDGRSLLTCIDPRTRHCRWEKTVPRVTHISLDADNLYLRCQDVLALNQNTGAAVWRIEATGCSPVTESDDLVYFIDRRQRGSLIAIERNSGRVAWRMPGVYSCDAFVRTGRRGYLKTEDSVLLAFALDL